MKCFRLNRCLAHRAVILRAASLELSTVFRITVLLSVLCANQAQAQLTGRVPSANARARARFGQANQESTSQVYAGQSHVISTRGRNVGTVKGGFADGPAATARFYYPQGLALGPRGEELYIVDGWNHRVRRADLTNGLVSTIAGSLPGFADGPADVARFHYPHSVAVSPDGSKLFVSDGWNQRIRVVSLATGEVFTLAGAGSAGFRDGAASLARFYYPSGLVVSHDGGALFVADTWNSRIRRIHIATGQVDTLAGGTRGINDGVGDNARFSFPRGICLSQGGDTLYVADTGNNCIRSVALASGQTRTIAGSQAKGLRDGPGLSASFTRPMSVAANSDDSMLFVADTGNAQLRAVALEREGGAQPGVYTVAANRTLLGMSMPLKNPADLTVSRDGRVLYVTDRDAQCVRRWFLPTGIVSTLVGSLSSEEKYHLSEPVYTRGTEGRVEVMSSTIPSNHQHYQQQQQQQIHSTAGVEATYKQGVHVQHLGLDHALKMEQASTLQLHQVNLAQMAPRSSNTQIPKERFRGQAHPGWQDALASQAQSVYAGSQLSSASGAQVQGAAAEALHKRTEFSIAQSGDSISVTTTVPLSYVLIAAVFAGSAVGVLMAAVLMVIMLRPDAIESIKPCVKVLFLPAFLVMRLMMRIFSSALLWWRSQERKSFFIVLALNNGAAPIMHSFGLLWVITCKGMVLVYIPAQKFVGMGIQSAVARFPVLKRLGPPLQRSWGLVLAGAHHAVIAWTQLRALLWRMEGKKRKKGADDDIADQLERTVHLPPRIVQLPTATLTRLQEEHMPQVEEEPETCPVEHAYTAVDPLGGQFVMNMNALEVRERNTSHPAAKEL
eukprot:CAMPEP_0114233506 /NCGR_PEP_ID=MMETSP0058-20121206/5202_1 /TAXON_ID=36894 /ORGANISM="Pyramimonas parkeae, CCMP726" /LENGTH=839 /DNA_ID=CAMNT_0001345103 /DNA_START=432 /DNA_END=2951 /DNA_ORIENTATION=-